MRKSRQVPQTETAGASVPFPPPAVNFAGMAIGFALHLFVPARIVVSERAERGLFLLGSVLLALSVGLAISAVVSFRQAQTTPYFGQASTSLIIRRPFRISRNPVYVAAALLH
jgi:protein-S-isoprenylcysteine O-methyltransferase Ste14